MPEFDEAPVAQNSDSASVPDYLAPLNPEQREAVLHTGSPLLILAGAGSGKTRVITTKIAYLIRERGVEPESILAVTFTNKAAREMAERAARIEPRASRAVLRTFHSFGAWFLRRNGSQLGLDSNFVIYDDDDSTTLLNTILENAPRSQAAQIAHLIARAKDYFLSPDDAGLEGIDHRPEFRGYYRKYEERLSRIGNVDFGDLIKKPVELLRAHPEIRERFRQRFQVVLVDEYQDSNVAQFELLKELCGPKTYLCVVGDDDQSIYRFRGAEVRNILRFPDYFPGTTVVRLERNYRSTSPILAVAGSVVDHNRDRLGKTLRSERGEGKLPTLAFLPDQETEASFCAELVERSLVSAKANYADWAILYRTNAQSLGFETEFLRRRIPYRVVGSLKFYEREEVKDALALFSFAVNPRDEVAFRRVVNKPTRGIGAASLERIIAEASRAEDESPDSDLAAAAKRIAPVLSAKARAGVLEFLSAIDGARAMLLEEPSRTYAETSATTASEDVDQPRENQSKKERGKKRSRGSDELVAGEGLSSFVTNIIITSKISEYHRAQDEIAGTQRLANLQELANAASLYPPTIEGLTAFLEHIELDRSMESEEQNDNAVTLITLHNTKGLEFRRVVMTGLEQGVFPRDDKRDEDLEEERRLFYVGATRAMDELYFTTCAQRRLYGRTMPSQPSLFLHEVPRDGLRVVGNTPSARAFSSRGGATREKKLASSLDGLWRVGGRLFHDDYGYGYILDVREGEDGPVVLAKFETGKEVRFMPRYQASSFMRIGNDG